MASAGLNKHLSYKWLVEHTCLAAVSLLQLSSMRMLNLVLLEKMV
jgi:hypothetical protein